MCKTYMDLMPLANPQLETQPTTQACALARNQTRDLSIRRLALNPLSHTSQGLLCQSLNRELHKVLWGP